MTSPLAARLSAEECLERIRAAGHKLTPQRREIVRLLSESPEPLTARQVHQALVRRFPGVSLDTVYRTLYLLVDEGISCQLGLASRANARFRLHGGPHHHHGVCLGCGAAFELAWCPLEPASRAVKASRTDFTVVGHAFELYGYCGACRP